MTIPCLKFRAQGAGTDDRKVVSVRINGQASCLKKQNFITNEMKEIINILVLGFPHKF